MPELPEVETIVRDLRPHLVGATVAAVEVGHPSVVRHPGLAEFLRALPGRRIERCQRRAKFIALRLDGPGSLFVHLGMSGTLTLDRPEVPARPHTHVRLRLGSGAELRYVDPRRFGRLMLGTPPELRAAGQLPPLGIEPLSPRFTAERLGAVLASTRRPLKAVLLDQARIAGCGNIYTDESCFLARVHPARPAAGLRPREVRRLRDAIRVVLRKAIRNRGSSIADYRDGFGARGAAHESLLVYGRGGAPCVRCGLPLAQSTVAGRTTVHCRGCQA